MTERTRLEPIDLVVETGASPETAWATLTDPARIALWFTDASPLGPVGAPYRLDFGDGSVVVGEVLEVDPGTGFVHSWAWEDAGPGEVTTVAWSVEALPGGGSRVRLVHDGWDAANGDPAARDDHEGYWTGYLDDLRDILDEA
jgi:uncharacterized protein YndB with AHSA1/START domain